MRTFRIFLRIIINLFLVTTYVWSAAIERSNVGTGGHLSPATFQIDLLRFRREIDGVTTVTPSGSESNDKKLYDVLINVNGGDDGEEGRSGADDEDEDGLAKTVKYEPEIPGNNLYIGNCSDRDKMLYIDNTVITNIGPSILNGTIEIYIDAAEPIKITCMHILDQIKDGTGGVPSYNSGGTGYDWVKIDVQGQYSKGFHFKTYVFGVPDEEKIKALKIALAEAEAAAALALSNINATQPV